MAAEAASERHQRVKQVFLDALEAPRGRRAAVVATACAGDEDLRREVLELFLVHGEPDPVLDVPLDGTEALAELALAPGVELGSWRLVEELGRGGMGVVFRAEREGREVALKVLEAGALSPEVRERFRLEAEILQRLDHPGIARVLDAGETERAGGVTHPWIAMELVVGRRLLDHVRDRVLTIEARLLLMADVADAVQHAHARGVVHCDLKPGNIVVRADGRPVVLDFGIARLVTGEERPREFETRTGQLVGTPQYMSPEQVQAEPAGVGTPADVYALGVILYELLSGQVPYEASSVSLHRAVISILTSEPKPLGHIVPALRGPVERIVACALEKEPRHRYPDAGALADDLRRVLAGRPVRARGPGLARRVVRWSRRRQRLAAVLAGVTLLAALLGALYVGARIDVPRAQVLATYREAETLVAESIPLLYERERTADSMRQVIDRLTRARALIGAVPALSHRDILVRRLEKDLGTAYMLLGELAWDVAAARQAVVTLEHASDTRYDADRSHLADQQVTQLGDGLVPPSELMGLRAGAHLGAYRLWGEPVHLHQAWALARFGLDADRALQADPRAPAGAREARAHLVGYACNALAEIATELAHFRDSPAAARAATAWSDSAWRRRDDFRYDWTAYGSLLYERGRAFLALGALAGDRAALDSAAVYLAACVDYRGPERPRIHAETRAALARLAAARAALEPGRRAEHLRRSQQELEAAHGTLARTAATAPQLAWLRAEQADVFVALALALGDPAVLDSARARLEETTEHFPPTSLPRQASLQWLRLGRLAAARHALTGDPAARAAAEGDFARARALARSRNDSLVLVLADRETRAHPPAGGTPPPGRSRPAPPRATAGWRP
jgi:predicted Ser/Thr protein kinase